jgi:hypothetical protein
VLTRLIYRAVVNCDRQNESPIDRHRTFLLPLGDEGEGHLQAIYAYCLVRLRP